MSLGRNLALALALALGLSFAYAVPAQAKVKIRVNLNLYPQPGYGDPYYGGGDPYPNDGYDNGYGGDPYPNDGYDNGYGDPGYGYPGYRRHNRGFSCTATNRRGYQFTGVGMSRQDASDEAWRACRASSRRCIPDPLETCERIRLRR